MGRRKQSYLGVGLYTVPEASRMVGVSARKVRRWLGYTDNEEGVIHRDIDDDIVTFAQLMELHFVCLFRSKGVTLQTIRRASRTASEMFRTNHPFSVQRFDTDGKRVFATLKKNEQDDEVVADLEKGQLVFTSVIKPFFKKIEYTDSDAMRFWPLHTSGRIVLDPKRRFGQPIDDETGVSVDAIVNELQAGGGQDENTVARWLGIPLEAVQAAVQYQKSLAT